MAGEALHDGIPGSELVVFEKGGHMLWADDPERFRKAVERFARKLLQQQTHQPGEALMSHIRLAAAALVETLS